VSLNKLKGKVLENPHKYTAVLLVQGSSNKNRTIYKIY